MSQWNTPTDAYERGMTDAVYLSYRFPNISEHRLKNVAQTRAAILGEPEPEKFVHGFVDLYHEIR